MTASTIDLLSPSADALGENGLFVRELKRFNYRESQVEMAIAIEKAIAQKHTLLAESGTGTGKTFAYLVPALLSGKRTLISTGTKHLQEQLFYRDIPTVLKTLGINAKVSLLKGRANYLCLHRTQLIRNSARRLDRKQKAEFESVIEWMPVTRSGDISEVGDVSEDSRLWSQLTSTTDNCIGQNCGYFDDCYVNKARKAALISEIVVINHHLYFADKSLKEDGFGSLLPEPDCVIFDEAHQIPDIASSFLGQSFSSWQVLELAADTRSAELLEKSLIQGLVPATEDLEKSCADFRLALGLNERRLSWFDLEVELPALNKKLLKLAEQIAAFAVLLEQAESVGEGLGRCYERATELSQSCRRLAHGEDDQTMVRWIEVARRTFRIHETPLNIGDALSLYFSREGQERNDIALIFTSATLSVDGDFSHFQQLVGVHDSSRRQSWDSPFDYFNQAVLYVPEGLPEPKEDGFNDAIYDAIVPLLESSEGHAFLLFTSFKNMQQFEDRLRRENDKKFSILMQGEKSKRDLLDSFVNLPNPLLLGTMSFWEGVDVPGDLLRLVAIDKLPFESPFEPVLKARLKAMQEAGDNPFMQYQVPRAVMTLRQGAGRLIRTRTDKGVLMICDARLRRTHYGGVFLNSLPKMRRTSDQQKVTGFLDGLKT